MSAIPYIIFVTLFSFGARLLYSSRDLIRLGWASYRWPKTSGTIVDTFDNSFTIPGIDNTGTGVRPCKYTETVHVYEYKVGDKVFRCDTFCFSGHAETSMAAYLIDDKVTVYYDPRNPQVAVLRRGLQPGACFGVLPIAIAVIYLFCAFVGLL